jgi:glutaredoxin 3
MANIEIYTQPYCPYCSRAVGLLTQKGVTFTEINAPHGTPERAQAVSRSGGRTTVPQIFVNGTGIGGCDDLLALERAGKLDTLLGL